MANLGKKDDGYVVRFRYQGKEYKRSLKTRSEDAAKAALAERFGRRGGVVSIHAAVRAATPVI